MKKYNIQMIENLIRDLDNKTISLNSFLDNEKYIDVIDLENFLNENNIELVKIGFTLNIFLMLKYKEYKSYFYKYKDCLEHLKSDVNIHNERYLNKKCILFEDACDGKVEGNFLSEEQLNAILSEDKNQLVLAGAGCGKTTTIVGKVKYLVKVMGIDPKEILLLSFSKKSAEDMKKRVEAEINESFDCFTFHKLGLDIIKEYWPNIKVYEGNLSSFIKDQIKKLLNDETYMTAFIELITKHLYLKRDEFKITKEEYDKLKNSPIITIDGRVVKSYGEMEIANYLFSNNIKYEYEKDYKINTKTNEYKQYQPDFYLPDYDIYIEYFGIDRNKNVPDYFESKHGKSPKEEYNDSIAWKKSTHKKFNTILIDLYYYDNKEGNLLSNLEKHLKKYNVDINPMTCNDIYRYIDNKNRYLLSNISNTFETIINLIKSNNIDFEHLKELSNESIYKDNIDTTLYLIKPIKDAYDEFLSVNKQTDFNDMISLAVELIKNGKYNSNYKYVIIDEFQDISLSRYMLLKALRDNNDYKIYCVGDDFQSIYRFNGSNIGIMLDFKKYFGTYKICKISNTHRFSNKLARISESFIIENPNQIKKNIYGNNSDDFPVSEIVGYNPKYELKFLEEKLKYLELNSSVLFLSRYNFDVEILKENENFVYSYDKADDVYHVYYKNRPDLKIKFMTIHKSKGLEADYVVILNNKRKYMGFPSHVTELPIMKILLDKYDDYPYSEERRLFYVALTRARKKVFLLVEKDNESLFIRELEYKYNDELKRECYTCPKCGGRLRVIEGKYSKFTGCSNYPECDFKR